MNALVMVGLIALVIVIAVIAWRQHQARQKALLDWAAKHGFSFDDGHDRGMRKRYPEFSSLSDGSNRYAFNVMRGVLDGRDVTAFHYHYETYSSDDKGNQQTHSHIFSAVIVEAGLPLKSLRIRPENMLDRMGEFLGFDDIDFEWAEFSRAFHVKAPEKRWAFDVLHQEAMEFLMDSPRITVEMQNGRVMASDTGRFAPEEFDAAIGVATGLLDRLPRTVVAELKGLH
jgi:hypothetical protein